MDNLNVCRTCDMTVCATCSALDTCIIPCNLYCLECNPDNTCASCHDGYYLEHGICLECDYKICQTCDVALDRCIIPC